MDIIKIKNADYSRYEELLLRREQLRKEAHINHGLYVKEFGDLHLQIFEKQVACIRKKKLIAYYQAAINRGGTINQAEIDAMLQREMEEYRKQLAAMAEENDAAKKLSRITDLDLLKIRRIYRRLAKQLHPDINPKTSEIPQLMELWNAITTAYNSNNLADMEELEVLVKNALEALKIGSYEIEIPDLDAKIEAVEAEINRIISTDPYQYKFLLSDPKAVEEKRQALEEQKQSYIDYEKQLDEAIEGILKSGVKIIWKMN